ncbi:MAG: hypothetical protein E7360_00445 [Clostridiales bacterium]|nr:hypothetical protein [Clostridiales bacterium]
MLPWILMLIASIVFFVAIVAIILPRMTLKGSYADQPLNDRGIKKENINGEWSFVFEPELKTRKFIKQYALIKSKTDKYAVLNFVDDLNYINYDIVVYGKENRVLTVINVKERVKVTRVSEKIALPTETAYVTILVNEADDKTFDNVVINRPKGKIVGLYFLLSTIAIFIESFCVKICLSFIFAGVFRESYLLDSYGNYVTMGLAVIISVIHVLITLISVRKRKNH